MHRLNLMIDALGDTAEKRSGDSLGIAMQAISDAGRGIVVVLREASSTSLSEMISQRITAREDEPDKSLELREYGVGAQILSDLGIRQMMLLSNSPANVISLEGYDLEITDWLNLDGTKK